MKSKTSFFNLSLLRRDVVRFAPAWVLYGVFLLLVFLGDHITSSPDTLANALGGSLQLFSLINLVYGLLCAQLLFGDLQNSRMCNALHALPARRESWFLTHTLAGLLFCLIPVSASGLVLIAILGSHWIAALLWIAGLCMQFLLFFSIGALSMILTGNRFAAVVVYCIINFMAGLVLWLYYALYLPHLYGVVLDVDPWLVLCPVAKMFTFDWFWASGTAPWVYLEDGWGYLACCAGIALVFLAAALLLYRRRHLEKAGDFVVFRPLAPVFLVLYTFSAGAALHLFGQVFLGKSTNLFFLIVGLAVGFFTGLMLLRRTIRVFRVKTFAQFGILLGVFGLTLLLTVFDLGGVTRWLPDADDVKSVTVNRMYASDEEKYAITDPELIKQVLSVQEHCIGNQDEGVNGIADVQMTFHYTMRSGRQVVREYYIDTNTVAAMTMRYVLSQPECIFGSSYPTAEALLEDVALVSRYDAGSYDDTVIETRDAKEDVLALLQAVYADAEAGTLCQQWPLYSTGEETYSLYIEGKPFKKNGSYAYESWYITYSPSSTNTYAAMNRLLP